MKKTLILTALVGGLLAPAFGQTADRPADAVAAAPNNGDTNAAPGNVPPPDAPPQPEDTTPQPPSSAPAAAPSDSTIAPQTPPPAPIPDASTPAAPAATDNTVTPPVRSAVSSGPVVTTNANGTWSMQVLPETSGAAAKTSGHVSNNSVSGDGLMMNFRDVPLEQVLSYLSDAAGFIIHPMNNVNVRGNVTAWSAQSLTKDEAYDLLQKMLNENGYSAIRDGRTLTIIRSADAKFKDRVISESNPSRIPNNEDMVTDIIPIHTLNAVQVAKDLEPLKPSGSTLSANDAANALVMTGTQSEIRHFTEILSSLDSVNSSSASIQVFPLKYADSKTIAGLIKDLYPSPDANARTGANGGFGRFRGGQGGGFPFGGGAPGGGAENPADNGHTPTAKVNAVSDDHSNSLIVSAPDELMPSIVALVKSVDVQVEDTTEVQVFHLKNADATEMADLLTSLFPDDTGSTDATRSPFRFGPFGGFNAGAATTTSDRAKKMSHVTAVPDRRTASLVVTTGKDLMPQISAMVMQLDSRTDRKIHPFVIPLANADPVQAVQILQDLFPASSSSRGTSSSTTTDPNDILGSRLKTISQQQNSSQNSTFGSGSSGGGGGSSSGRGF